MNSKIFLSCILCNKIGANFRCERCSETYCSKHCQVIHWPIHRRMCFPMPNLIELENQSISFNQSQSPPDRYSTTGEHSTEWSPYNPVKSVKKSFNAKQNHNLIVSQKSRFSNHSLSQKLPDVPDNFSEFSGPNSTGHVNPYLTTYPFWEEPQIEANLRLKEWSEEFLFGEVTEVIVQYFAESPTTTCWVIQRRDVDQRNAILKNLNFYRTFDSIETVDTIKNDNVYSVQFEGGCHRGIVLYRINSREVWVRLIDNGRSFRTRINAIRAFTQFSANLKGLAFEINFETLRSIAVGDVLRVKNISCNPNGVIEVRIVEDSTIFTDKDIKSVPLPVDVPLELFCLDYSNIHKGYISACENDPTKIESITGISYRIAEYCEKTNGEKNYCPKLNELCLAYAADEGQWYRSKCRETVMPNTFRLEMIDYGVLEEVSSKNIRKMVEEFMEPTIMHRCTIFGVPPRPDSETINAIIAYFSRNPIFCIKRALLSRLSGGQNIIHLPDLLKFIDELQPFGK